MAPYTEGTFLTQNACSVQEQILLMRYVLDLTTEKLIDVRERMAKAHEELRECTEETKRRVDLLKENTEVIAFVVELGQLMEKERILRELRGSEEDRRRWRELQHRHDTITNKVQSLTCEVVEVKK